MTYDEEFTEPPSEETLRVRALESLLVDKGLIVSEAVDEIIDQFENKLGPRNGATVVARAWVDERFRARLLEDATEAAAELGFEGKEGAEIVALENTPGIHNVVVCTLCSCYPWPLLGLPPTWYKSPQYRSRVVIEPRKVLAEFGLHVPDDVEVRVWDSNAEIRFLVVPMRPEGTEGWNEAALADLVTRNSMIGTGLVTLPGAPA